MPPGVMQPLKLSTLGLALRQGDGPLSLWLFEPEDDGGCLVWEDQEMDSVVFSTPDMVEIRKDTRAQGDLNVKKKKKKFS